MGTPVTPYNRADVAKKAQVTEMFDSIAPSYDLLNHTLSMGIDIIWRRTAVNALKSLNPKIILDIATGTGDFAVEATKLKPQQVIGIDISEGMLNVGREKVKKLGLENVISLEVGDSENLRFEDNYADAITVGFGVRNFENLEKGLGEMLRVLKKGGRVAILEPSTPSSFPLKQLFGFYFMNILPLLGRLVSKDKTAYTYLPNSVAAFPAGKAFTDICLKVGYSKATYKPLTLGICAFYLLEK